MATSLLKLLLKIAAAFTTFCVLALANLYAATGPNLLPPFGGNGTSVTTTGVVTPGWIGSAYQTGGRGEASLTAAGPYSDSSSVSFGISNVVGLTCAGNCPLTGYNSLSTQVQGLVSGHQYRLSYYAWGWAVTRDYATQWSPSGSVVVSLGSERAPPITPSNATWGNQLPPWGQQTYTFNYNGPSTTAWLTFYEYFLGIGSIGCVPCGEGMQIAKPSLTDVTPFVAPTLKVQKALGTAGRIDNADQFKVSIVNASTSVPLNSATTGGTGTTITGGLASITGDTTTTDIVVEEMAAGSNSKLAQYDAVLSCSNTNRSGTQFPAGSVQMGQNFPLLKSADDVTCSLTNTPKAPVLRLSKALGAGGRADPADQFITVIQERLLDKWSSPPSTGNGSAIGDGSTGWVTLALNTPYTLKETMKPGNGSVVTQYTPVVTCTNALTGSTTVVPSTPGIAFTPVPGDVLDCTITNTRLPVQLRVSQRLLIAAPYVFKPPVDFTYTGNNGWVDQPLRVLKDNQITTGATQALTAPLVQTTLSATTTAPNWYVASYRCTDDNASKSGNSPALVATSNTTSVTILPNKMRAGALITCAMIQTYRQ